MITIEQVSQETISNTMALLKLREGTKLIVYPDTKDNPTVGTGHLVTDDDNLVLDDVITQSQADTFLRNDMQDAMIAAVAQMNEARITDIRFLPYLTSVCFQLGTKWTAKFKPTWKLICSREYDKASEHIASSLWAEETPVRARDFIDALHWLKVGSHGA